MPKKITISDGIGHFRTVIALVGDQLFGDEDSAEHLTMNGFGSSEDDDEEEIYWDVYNSWVAHGYHGDPKENGLAVHVDDIGKDELDEILN